MITASNFTSEQLLTARRIADAWKSLADVLLFGGAVLALWGGIRHWSITKTCVGAWLSMAAGGIIWVFVIPRSVESFFPGMVVALHGGYGMQPDTPAACVASAVWAPLGYGLGWCIRATLERMTQRSQSIHQP